MHSWSPSGNTQRKHQPQLIPTYAQPWEPLSTEAFKLQRARIQALSTADIQSSLKHNTLSIQEVTAHIIPCIDLFCGIGGFSKGVHNGVNESGKMIKIFLVLDNDSTRLRAFQRNNTGIPSNLVMMTLPTSTVCRNAEAWSNTA